MKMKKSDKVLVKIIPLAAPLKLPSTFSELNKMIWESFKSGREYESQLQREIPNDTK